MINYISHKKSKQIVNGLPKLPTSDQLKEGEIAINYANGYETLSIKNSDNEITTFSSTEQFEKYVDTTLGNKLGSGFTGENSANTVTSIIEENEKIASASLNDLNERKLDASAYTPTDLSDYYKKEETSGKTEIANALGLKANTSDLSNYYKKTETSGSTQLTTAFGTKANTSDLTSHTGNTTAHITSDERTKWNGKISNAQYSKNDKKIYFYSGATTETPVSNIDATDFIKDGMVSSVEIKDVTNSGSCLVITFNVDAGKENIVIPVSKIFNSNNYYLKSETSGKTEIATALNSKANTSDLSNYYKKTETSGSTQLTTAFNSKANTTDLTTHTGNSTIHITADERTKWNNAATSSHTHANKDVLDKITAIDTELSETSNNLVVNSAITKVIVANEKISSSALNELNDRKLDASAYTPTDLSGYYKKEETSGKTEIANALGLKADTSVLSGYYKKTETSGSTQLTTAFNSKADTSALTAHTGNSAIHITADERTKWNNAATTLASHTGNTTAHITSDERSKWNGKISNVLYNKTDKKIYFYSGATTETPISNIDATDFIKDGMVSNVEIKDVANSGSCLVITFNADAGKQNIVIPVSKIFNPANYYLKSETSGKTEISTALNLKANTSDLSNYYKKTETSGSTQLTTALNSKANATDLTAHTGNSTIHITSDERTKWNNASTNSHTHTNKAVLDSITAIDTELSETSNNLVVNSAITMVILANERIASSSLNDLNERKLDASAYTPTDLSDYYKKEETSGKTELNTAFGLKANASDLASHTGNTTAHVTAAERTKWNGKISAAQYNKADKKIYFYSGATTETPVSSIDATDFIKDGMVSNVEIKDVASSGSCLVITFNSDAGKQNITIPISKIFNSSNYYLKSETSGKTEISTALNLKANTADLTAHTGNSTVHITTDERTKWNNAVASSHTHSNKSVLDKITAIDTELSETSNNLVVNSAITTVILANEKITSSSLNDLNEKKLDVSAYTPTDLSDYYKKEETSGKSEIATALGLKANTTDLTAHTGNSTIHITADERTKWNNAVTNSHTHANKAVLDKITAIDTELSETSNNLVVNSAITKVIVANEKISSSALNELNDRKLDASAYTPTNLSDYYKKEETSGKSEIATALSSKANASTLSNYYKKTETSGSTQLTTAFNSKANTGHTHLSKDITDKVTAITESNRGSTSVPTVSAVMQVFKDNEEVISSALNDLNKRINQLNALIKNYEARIKALESK